MPWVRLDDQFPDHPKVVMVGPLGGWLHVCALAYCNRYLTDGFIPAAQVPKLVDFTGILVPVYDGEHETDADPLVVANDLVKFGVWDACEGGYRIHDYLDYQPSKAEVQAKQKVKQEAGRKGGLVKQTAKQNGSKTEAKQEQTGKQNGSKTVAPSRPVPSRPDPGPSTENLRNTEIRVADATPESGDSGSVTKPEEPTKDDADVSAKPDRKRRRLGEPGTRISSDWKPKPETLDAFRKEGVDASAHVGEFVDYWIGVPGSKALKVDWEATFRNRIRALVRDGRARTFTGPVPATTADEGYRIHRVPRPGDTDYEPPEVLTPEERALRLQMANDLDAIVADVQRRRILA